MIETAYIIATLSLTGVVLVVLLLSSWCKQDKEFRTKSDELERQYARNAKEFRLYMRELQDGV